MSATPLAGQTTVLVGATGNIGPGLIAAQLDAGANIVLIGRNTGRLEAVRQQFDTTDRITPIQGDIGTLASAEKVAAAVTDRVGQPDHLVVGLNAWMQGQPVWAVDETAWDRSLAITTGYFAASRAFAPRLRPGGSLTHILGLSAYVTLPLASPVTIYGGALRAMRPAFSQDLGDQLRVNSAAFAVINSPSRGANVSPDWLTDRQVGDIMTRIAATDITGQDLTFPDIPSYETFMAA